MTLWTVLKLFSLIYYGIDQGALKKIHEFMQEISIPLSEWAQLLVPSKCFLEAPLCLPVSEAHLW